jgi:hypothetical protein
VNAFLFIVFFLGVLVALGTILNTVRMGRKRRRFAKREELALDEIYALYYAHSGLDKGRVLEAWNQAADILRLAPGRLRPDDRFDGQLGPAGQFWGEDETMDLNHYVRTWCKKHGVPLPSKSLDTLDDLILFLCQSSDSSR